MAYASVDYVKFIVRNLVAAIKAAAGFYF